MRVCNAFGQIVTQGSMNRGAPMHSSGSGTIKINKANKSKKSIL